MKRSDKKNILKVFPVGQDGRRKMLNFHQIQLPIYRERADIQILLLMRVNLAFKLYLCCEHTIHLKSRFIFLTYFQLCILPKTAKNTLFYHPSHISPPASPAFRASQASKTSTAKHRNLRVTPKKIIGGQKHTLPPFYKSDFQSVTFVVVGMPEATIL